MFHNSSLLFGRFGVYKCSSWCRFFFVVVLVIAGGSFECKSEQIDFDKDSAYLFILFSSFHCPKSIVDSRENLGKCFLVIALKTPHPCLVWYFWRIRTFHNVFVPLTFHDVLVLQFKMREPELCHAVFWITLDANAAKEFKDDWRWVSCQHVGYASQWTTSLSLLTLLESWLCII